MRGWIVACLAVLVLGAPSAIAYHLSTGGSATLAAEPQESPEDPSVGPSLHARGTGEDCPPKRLGNLAEDPLCGVLSYHANATWVLDAPPDQLLNGRIDVFDVRVTHYAGSYGLETCLPFCLNSATEEIGRSLRAIGNELGVHDEDPRGSDDQRFSIGAQAGYAGDIILIGPDAGDGDGWLLPATDLTFVAFLQDNQGNPIGPAALDTLVAQHPDLDFRAQTKVCGFAAEANLRAPDGQPGCDVPFEFRQEDEDQAAEACQSPTYVCQGPDNAWQANVVCGAVHGRCQLSDPTERSPPRPGPSLDGPAEPQRPGDSTTQPAVWHFVVAPVPSECQGRREPGFLTNSHLGTAYLAHDLDLYTPPDTAADGRHATPLVGQPPGELTPILTGTYNRTVQPVWRSPAPEPNEAEAPIADTSRRRTIDRAWHECRLLEDPPESPETLDPWGNLLDAHLVRERTGDHLDGSLEIPTNRDGDRARTGTYVPTGKSGFFADVDDDGAYDPVPWERQFDEVTRTGAYPLLWDMHVDREGEIDPDAGCAIRGGLTSTDLTLTEAMTEAGYRSRTGLIQAFAFDEPIAWEHRPTDRLAVFPTGGVFLQASQALHRQGPHGEATDPTVSQHVHAVVEAATQAAGLHDPDVVVLQDLSSEIGADDGYVSDFQAQCGESTGGFTSRWSLTRACSGQGNCSASASVTRALVDIGDASDAYLAHERWAQPFPAGHREAFPGGLQAWTDVDLLGPG